MDEFEVLIGTWTTEAKHRLVDEVVSGETTFEWLEGRKFLLQRSHADDERFPDGLWVIGSPESGEGLVAEYFDSRGVRRTYEVSIEDGVWRVWRDAPGFDQRFEARIGADEFEGLFQLAEQPGEWMDDLKVSYRRAK